MIPLLLDNAPRTAMILGAVLSGGDALALAAKLSGYVVTENPDHPKGFRFEASRHDGEPSVFAETREALNDELNEREGNYAAS